MHDFPKRLMRRAQILWRPSMNLHSLAAIREDKAAFQMIYSAYSANQRYRVTVSEEFDGSDPQLNHTYYTLKVFDRDLNQTIYQTNRFWVADQIDEYQDGVQIHEVGFDDRGEILLINNGLTSPNCVPFVRIVKLVDDILITFPDEVDAYKLADSSDGNDSPELPKPLIEMIREQFNGMGLPHDWMGHLQAKIGEELDV